MAGVGGRDVRAALVIRDKYFDVKSMSPVLQSRTDSFKSFLELKSPTKEVMSQTRRG